jgi:hypothetical protein
VRRVAFRGRTPSSSTRLHERRVLRASGASQPRAGERAGGCMRPAPLKGRRPSDSTRLREGAAPRTSGTRPPLREQKAVRDAPRLEAEGCLAAQGSAGAAPRASGARQSRARERLISLASFVRSRLEGAAWEEILSTGGVLTSSPLLPGQALKRGSALSSFQAADHRGTARRGGYSWAYCGLTVH